MRVCSSCGTENPEEARFCLACGTPFAEERPAREVRKTVTVLFTDVTGSTALGERLDPESLRRVMSRYFEEMRSVIERHGGTVEKFIGDAVMAVFGIPTLHEDDALRAVRAAAEMREALASLNAELERDRGVSIAVRTGVNTGEVVAGDHSAGQSLVIGDAVNVAARFEQAASPGEILLGEPTYRLVRDAVEVETLEPLSLKGKGEAVPAYRLIGVTPGAPGTARRMDSPMVGRERERSLLAQAFDRATSERACHLFTVLGAPGVGKTRLVSEFSRQVEGQAGVLVGRCLPYGEGITYWPVIEVVKAAAGITEEDTPERARDRVGALLSDEDQGPLITDLIGHLLGLSQASASAEETLWAIRKLLEGLARQRPLVLEFDDIHWAEPTLLDLIEHIADWSRDAPILLLCLARPDLLDHRPGWGGGKLNATSILLEPLSEEECDQLIANLLGATGLAESVRGRIAEAAEGNPLFVEEMLFMLIDDGMLRRRDGHWEAGDLSRVSVPPNIRALITARLDRLGGEERAVIERASVEGRVFHRGAVAELSAESARSEVLQRLMGLVRKELIRPDRAEFLGEDAFRFRHILIRDSAYDSLPKEARADLHERFAAWMERAAGKRAPEYEEIIGYHLEQAHRYRSELGPLDDRGRALAERAAARLAAAGRRAQARGDEAATANLLERASVLMLEGSPQRNEVLLDLGVALGRGGEFGRAADVLEEAAAAADVLGDRSLATLARLERDFQALSTETEADWAQLLEEVEEAIRVFEEAGDERGLMRAGPMRTAVLFWTGRAGAAKESLERSVAVARRSGDPRAVSESVVWSGAIALWGPLPAEDALRWLEEFHDLVRGRAAEAALIGHRGALLAMVGRVDEGRRLHERARELEREHGMTVFLAADHPGAEIELAAGNPQGLVERLEPGLVELRAMGERGFLSTSAALAAEGMYGVGRYEEAEALTHESEEAAPPDDIASQPQWRAVRAKLLARRGETEEADRLSREAVEIASGSDHLTIIALAFTGRAEALRLAGRTDEAIEAAQRALETYERKGHLMGAARARALLEELRTERPAG